ncbi:hypothetical protein [Paenibacillus sedimenti]|uniref:Uncharacterized protein n=1 Tax=Paenibacillus sedimenti TaxID=2770274 RepID=A0A926KSX2_9BACL|nr:hypothetical protein [Paenibacillus sedimenti]MBD0382561.1 hypothetical protein [Paenibacillus sedimenti]
MNYPPSYYPPQPHTLYGNYPLPAAVYPTPYWVWNRDFPPVDTTILAHSVVGFQKLMKDASIVLSKLSDQHISNQIMTAAQTGNQKEVDRIVHAFGCESLVMTGYTPSGVQFKIDPRDQGVPCCSLTMMLKWGR